MSANDLLLSLVKIEDQFSRMLAVCSVITKEFRDRGLFEPIIVGGTAMALYSKGQYATVDLDLKSEQVDSYKQLMGDLGFIRKNRDFYHPVLDAYVEFPSGRMEDSEHHFREVIVKDTGLPIYLVGYEDLIIDRAMRFDATRDLDAREWALRLMGSVYEEIDWSYLHKRAGELKLLDVLNRIQRDVKKYKGVYKELKSDSDSQLNLNDSED